MKKLMIAVVAAAPLALSALAATLEVGPHRKYSTIQSAADVAQPGDTVLIDPGIYREWVKPANAGTKDAPITYRARERGKTVITGADVVAGKVTSRSDERRTPIWEPHSAKLREMLNDCGDGDFRHYNNVMAFAPPAKGKYPNVAADNAVIPPENWTITSDGRCTVKGAPPADFKPVDTARLGRNALGRQAFENRDGTPYVWDAAHSPAVSLLRTGALRGRGADDRP